LFNINAGGESKMKKIVLFSMIALAGITVSAADMTKEQFVATKKAAAEKAGTEFNEKAVEAAFAKRDLNKDGVLSADELKPAPKKAAQ
jgi:5,10-methylene-tetrahydrofolate dehydrogenase/methenyl tetrahydrofolate cyclohydrolase